MNQDPAVEKRKPPGTVWPKIRDEEDADRIIQRAVGLMFFQATISLILFGLSFTGWNPFQLDFWSLITIGGDFLFAYFILKRSILAASIAVLLYFVDRGYIFYQNRYLGPFLLHIYIGLFYVSALRGAIFLRRSKTEGLLNV